MQLAADFILKELTSCINWLSNNDLVQTSVLVQFNSYCEKPIRSNTYRHTNDTNIFLRSTLLDGFP